jgi:hypothetical protein
VCGDSIGHNYERAVLVAVALVAGGGVVFDLAAVSRQFGAHRTGVGPLAVPVAALHLAVVAAAGALLRTAGRPQRA